MQFVETRQLAELRESLPETNVYAPIKAGRASSGVRARKASGPRENCSVIEGERAASGGRAATASG
eukprot:5822678-Prymnesium_polylepis.1